MFKLFTAVLVMSLMGLGENLAAQTSYQAALGKANSVATVSASGALNAGNPAVIASKASASPAVRGFKEWKNEKVQSAIKSLTITKAQIEYKRLNKQFFPPAAGFGQRKDTELERLETLLKNDLYSLEVAQELTVTDYFAIYLTKQENKAEAYKEAAQKMTSEEVSQLIKAYADSMFSAHSNGGSGTKVGPTAMEKAEAYK